MNDRTDDKLINDARKLQREIAPSRDLWPEIEAAILEPVTAEKPAGWTERFMPYLAQAAAIVLLVGASSTATYYLVGADKAGNAVTPMESGLSLSTASWAGEAMSADFTQTRSNVQAQLEQELQKLSPESRNEVERNLRVIRAAIEQINAELENEPDNTHLQELLRNSYQDELAVMQNVGGLTQSVMSRNDI